MQKLRFRADRLLKLAAHLENGRPGGHKKFDFSQWHENHGDEFHCGTAGCAIGELPVVFPRLAVFDSVFSYLTNGRVGVVTAPEDKELRSWSLAAKIFGIPYSDSDCLFTATKPRWWAPKLLRLTDTATAKQVARSIRLYVQARKELKSSERP